VADTAAGIEYDFDIPEAGIVKFPPYLNYGVSGAQQEQLGRVLPVVSAHAFAQQEGATGVQASTVVKLSLGEQVHKANMLGKVMDLRNANAGGIAYENRRRIVAEFSEPGKLEDTGRPEVQGGHPSLLS
jgi:small subunit ribosomal protein S15